MTRLPSERVIINAPMSFAGSAQRAWRLRQGPLILRLLLTPLAAAVTFAWWLAIIGWYGITLSLLWFLFFPYRILRRGARKRKAEARRHRELLAAIDKKQL